LGCADTGDGTLAFASSAAAAGAENVVESRAALDDADELALGDSSDAAAMDASATPPELTRGDSFPEALDYRNVEGRSYVTEPKNQGSCGGCWAFTSAGVFESKLLLTLGMSLDLSEQQQISLNSKMNGCNGGTYSALSFWSTAGNSPLDEACTGYAESTSPLVSLASCTARPLRLLRGDSRPYTVDVADARAVKKSLLDDGPAYFRFDVFPEFYSFWRRSAVDGEAPVYTQAATNSPKRGGHAVLLIGWDDARDAWLLKNSWGASSGPNGDGTFWVARSGHGKSLAFGIANTRRPEVSVGVEESFLRNSGLRAGAGSPALPVAWTPVDGWPAGKGGTEARRASGRPPSRWSCASSRVG
jgi:C1A family cysteine protease